MSAWRLGTGNVLRSWRAWIGINECVGLVGGSWGSGGLRLHADVGIGLRCTGLAAVPVGALGCMGASCIGGHVELHTWVWLRVCLGVHWQAWHALAGDSCAQQGTNMVISSIQKGGQVCPYLGEETGWETVSMRPGWVVCRCFQGGLMCLAFNW